MRFLMGSTGTTKEGVVYSRPVPSPCLVLNTDPVHKGFLSGIPVKNPLLFSTKGRGSLRKFSLNETLEWNGTSLRFGGSLKKIEINPMDIEGYTIGPIVKSTYRDKLKGKQKQYQSYYQRLSRSIKLQLIQQLLKHGQVKTNELFHEFLLSGKICGPKDIQEFKMACAIIKDYCDTGGENIRESV